jgi:hypothetical protein
MFWVVSIEEILNWFHSGMANALLEGYNSFTPDSVTTMLDSKRSIIFATL